MPSPCARKEFALASPAVDRCPVRARLVQRTVWHMVNEIAPEPSLGRQIKDLRKRFGGKQWWLAHAIGCTVAAVSLWETGKRTPQASTMARIVHALSQAGVAPSDVARLCKSWREATLNCVEHPPDPATIFVDDTFR